ncbi:hypothetical protein KIH87_13550 [Paraneptunicella aestuarii]|uniref:hypothetical protein n=1 Tax=Paraneptunicella aestuarii TaxID=2831148 RepID=UPI001E647F11|nr:hypothetical protein [Paraneptunicella aestuarii]UAA37728.1 hypothetical protein KIH87_13550 [Paraneptunicella aestuarii]
MKIKLKLGAVMLFALLSASAQAGWFNDLFGSGTVEASSGDSTITIMGPGGGGGNPPGPDPN